MDHLPRCESATGLKLEETTFIYVATTREELSRRAGGRIPDWGIGVALPDTRTMVLLSDRDMPAQHLVQPIEAVAVHELVHLLLGRREGIPLWFHEGCAMFLSFESRPHQTLKRSSLTGSLLSLQGIDSLLQFDPIKAELAYEQSHSAFRYLVDRFGVIAIRQIIEALDEETAFSQALYRVTGSTHEQFEADWHGHARRGAWMVWVEAWDDLIWFVVLPFLVLLAWGVKKWRERKIKRQWQEEESFFSG